MRKIIMGCVAAMAIAATADEQSVMYKDEFRQAVQGAIDEAEASIAASKMSAKSAVAILPIGGDSDGWLAGQLKIALTRAGKTCVEGKEDPAWAEILKEIEWDERKEDILDKATLDKFGRLKSAQTLLYAFVRAKDMTDRYAFFEIELHATEIATKQHIWGGVFAKRHYKPGFENVGKVTGVPVALRETMQTKVRDAVAKSIGESKKLGNVKTVALLPFAADNDGYAASIVRDALTQTKLSPLNLDLATLAEARLQVRDKPGQADGIIYGALRDYSWRIVDKAPNSTTWEFVVEVQACVESAAREQLWSKTILVQDTYTEKEGVWVTLCRWFPSLEKRPWLLVVVPLSILIGLVVFFKFLGAVTRVK